jgi:hypothetical protein
MTAAHIVYIPIAMLLGLVSGYVLGARAARREIERRRQQAQR